MMISSFDSIYSQNRAIKGLVIDEGDFEFVIGAEIIINDSINVGKTGRDGRFQFETSLKDFKLKITNPGWEEHLVYIFHEDWKKNSTKWNTGD